MKLGFVVGRFQPLHLGHIYLIEEACSQVDRLIVFIGSSNESRSFKNPLNFEERAILISNTFSEEIVSKLILKPLPDYKSNDHWVAYIKSETNIAKYTSTTFFCFNKDEDTTVSNKLLFELCPHQEVVAKQILSATDVREKIRSGVPLKDISELHPTTSYYLKTLGYLNAFLIRT